MQSASKNKVVVDEYLRKEVELGRVVGPLNPAELPQTHTSRFEVIPKSHQPGKWRLIVALSHPEGAIVNDGIEKEICSLTYSSLYDAIRIIRDMGKGTRLAKFDIESIRSSDRLLLGMSWRNSLYIDTALPF